MNDANRADSPFVLRWRDRDGEEHETQARAVVDATGAWTQPNPIGVNGLPVLGEAAAREFIDYGIPNVRAERERFAGKRILVVGGGHSAINVALKGCEVVEPFAVIQEVFSQSCAFSSCHSAESRQANLVLSDEELSWANLVLQDPTNPEAFAMGLRRVVPGSPERSYLIRKLKGLGPGDGMPLALPQLPENVIHIIEDWIRRGAPTTEDECTPLPATSGGGMAPV